MEIFCIQCGGRRSHSVLKEVEKNTTNSESWWEDNKYQIVQCDGCKEITFRKMYSDMQTSHYAEDDNRWVETLYPHRNRYTRIPKAITYFPEKLRVIYLETIKAFNENLPIICTAGLRALIEGICLDKKILGKEITTNKGVKKLSESLESKIDGLQINGSLTADNCSALHELRFLGNDALHELTPPDVDDLILAIDIVELTLNNIYDLGHKIRKLKNSTGKKL